MYKMTHRRKNEPAIWLWACDEPSCSESIYSDDDYGIVNFYYAVENKLILGVGNLHVKSL